jgi:hypothetical protein
MLVPSLVPAPKPSAPIVDVENELTDERRVSVYRDGENECNPGPLPEGVKLEDFICNHHVKKGAPGHCMGYYLPRVP